MRILFMGTPEFARPALEKLHKTHEIVGVVTRPDAPSSRGKKLYPSVIKEKAQALNISPIIETNSLKSDEVFNELKALNPELIVVAAYGAILPKRVIDLALCINIHASLLPAYRGAAPIERAILAGEPYAGVSIMKMEEGLDTGAFALQAQTEVGNKSSEELTEELGELGADLLLSALEKLEAGSLEWTLQDESHVSYAQKIDKREMRLHPDLTQREALLKIQASSDSAPAKARIFDRNVRVLKAQASSEKLEAGQAQILGKRLVLGAKDASFEIVRLKPDGKSEMDASSFIQGIRSENGSWGAL
ncbi:MAG: methionyl-tRNA formyltransferase [Coriobacteriia bacterium]|nr:methionyl-tRNA formyltransferase [Coriobacteriia bacterium]